MQELLTICDVGLRDGLQNEKSIVSTFNKCRILDLLVEAGIPQLELSSFVNPKIVPQMFDAEEMVAYAKQIDRARCLALVINEKGYDRALSAGVKGISLVLVCSETFSQKNNRMSLDQTLAVIKRLMERAKKDGLWTRVNFSATWVCPYEGKVLPATVIKLVEEVFKQQPDELVLADTVGRAHPIEVANLCHQLGERTDISRLVLHMHDTQALALANCAAGIQAGIRRLDGSIAGLGGCPFAPGASGNVATEDLVFMVHKMGFRTGIDLLKLYQLVSVVEEIVEHPVGGRVPAHAEIEPSCE